MQGFHKIVKGPPELVKGTTEDVWNHPQACFFPPVTNYSYGKIAREGEHESLRRALPLG